LYIMDGNYQNPYSYQNQGGPTYGDNNSYGSGNGGGYQYQPGDDGDKNKKKKSGGFGKKLATCIALALVFGAVSGAAFQGVQYAGNKLNGNRAETTVSENASGDTSGGSTGDTASGLLADTQGSDNVATTSTSSNYVATDVSDIVESVMPSIVAITNISQVQYQSFWGGGTQTYQSTSAGSGIIVAQDDNNLYIVTNNHVVDGATSLTVAFADESTVSAEIKGTDPSTDLAVIRVDMDSIESDTMANIKVATLGDSEALKVGQASIAIGNALGYGQSVTTGCISALNREVSVSDSSTNTSYTAELIQTDAAINPGNSGGALLDATGKVIGINSVKYSSEEVEGIGYAIPINTAKPIIEDLITKEKVDGSNIAYLGIGGVDVTSDVSKNYNMPTGVYVARIIAGSAAENAGIQKGDIITAIDGKAVGSMSELTSRLEYYSAGETVPIVIQRVSNGEYVEQTIDVTLGKKL
jgi:serine protease Do